MALGDVWSRSQWATRQPGWTGMQDRCPEVFIHHIGAGAPAVPTVAWMRQFEDNALAAGRARGDSYIAIEYHRLIFLDGTDVECRPDGTQGGATKNHNAASYAICLAGDFRTTAPTSQLIEAVRRRIEVWKGTGRVASNASVRPHSDVFPTACPGDKTRAVIPQFTRPGPPPEEDVANIDHIGPDAKVAIKDAVVSAQQPLIAAIQDLQKAVVKALQTKN